MGSIESVPAAFELTVVDGRGRLSWKAPAAADGARETSALGRWAALEALELDVPALGEGEPSGRSDGHGGGGDAALVQLRNRRLALRGATLQTSDLLLTAALTACPLHSVGVIEARVWMAPDGPRLVGRFSQGARQAPFTIRVAIDPRATGHRRLRIDLGDVRIYGHVPLPAPLIGAAVARAIASNGDASRAALRASGPSLAVDALEVVLTAALVTQGWRLPEIKRGWWESVAHDGDTIRLRFASEGHPTLPLATLEDSAPSDELLSHLEGERLPAALSAAEACLMAGDVMGAESAYRATLEKMPGNRATRARLLALTSSTGSQEAAALADALMDEWPDFLPGFLYGAVAAREGGDDVRAAALFARVAALASERGEREDAALARAAQAESVARALTRAPASIAAPAPVAASAPETHFAADDLIDMAVARGDLGEAERLFDERLASAQGDQERTAVLTARARIQLLGANGSARALATLRDLPLATTPEEGLVLRADLAERIGDIGDARQTLEELMMRAVAAGDMSRARELAARQAELSQPHQPPPPPATTNPTSGDDQRDDAVVTADPDLTAMAIPQPVSDDDKGRVTGRTQTAYGRATDPEARTAALGALLEEFEQLPPQPRHDAYTSFGRVAEAAGDLEYSEEAYWRASRVDGDPARRADDLLAHARVLLSRGNAAAAVAELEESLRLKPEHAGALALLAEQAFQARDWPRARDFYRRLADVPDSPDALARETLQFRRAALARLAGDTGEAERAYGELALIDAGHIDARVALAELALERHDLVTAAARLDEVLRLLPMDALEALLNVRERLGEIHVGLGDWGAARYYLEMVLAQDPGRVVVLELLADVYGRLGLHVEAAGAWERLARLYLQPRQRAEALFRQGELLGGAFGDDDRAFDTYLKSSDLDPSFVPTALRLVAGYFSRGQFQDVAEVGEDLRRAGGLAAMAPSLRLRLALATSLARDDDKDGDASADLVGLPWDADTAADVLAETRASLATRPPQQLERAMMLLEAWRTRGDAAAGAPDRAGTLDEDDSADGHGGAEPDA